MSDVIFRIFLDLSYIFDKLIHLQKKELIVNVAIM